MFARSGVVAIFATSLLVGSGQAALAQTAWVADGGSLSLSLDYAYSSSNKGPRRARDRGQTGRSDPESCRVAVGGVRADRQGRCRAGYSSRVVALLGRSRGSGISQARALRRRSFSHDAHGHAPRRPLHARRRQARRLAIRGTRPPADRVRDRRVRRRGPSPQAVPVGFAIGTIFGGPFERLFVHGTYEFVLSERYRTDFNETGAVGQNRSDASLLAGYAFTDRLQANLAGNLRLAHGGIAFEDARKSESPVLYTFHDPLLAEWFLLAGGGVSYQLTPSLRVDLLLRLFVLGEMTRNAHSLGGGMSWDVL